MKNKVLLEYIWLDGYNTANLRSKVKVLDMDSDPTLNDIPMWNFDGSSTQQATTKDSERILQPVALYSFNEEDRHYFVLNEVYYSDGKAHESNTRYPLTQMDSNVIKDFWFGFEQEYFITKHFNAVKFDNGLYPKPQGLYYCGVGENQINYRDFVEEHLKTCLAMGLDITGINAEVAPGQWEYQCFGKGTLNACDSLVLSRYLLHRIAEKYGVDVELHPKPIKGDWNGSGCHANFSDEAMRSGGDKNYFDTVITNFKKNHESDIKNYGEFNDQRLTGNHETQSIEKFNSGIGSRNTSIRIPLVTAENWKGYMEDRRPSSNCDPYKVSKSIIDNVLGNE